MACWKSKSAKVLDMLVSLHKEPQRVLSKQVIDSSVLHRNGYDRELITLLTQLVRDMNRKIERQKERAIIESSAKPISIDDKARLDAIKVSSMLTCSGWLYAVMTSLSHRKCCCFTKVRSCYKLVQCGLGNVHLFEVMFSFFATKSL